jgi:hypothetical protein
MDALDLPGGIPWGNESLDDHNALPTTLAHALQYRGLLSDRWVSGPLDYRLAPVVGDRLGVSLRAKLARRPQRGQGSLGSLEVGSRSGSRSGIRDPSRWGRRVSSARA